jgi:hypothetical protein
MGSRYLFIVLIVFLEHHLTRGDYRRTDFAEQPRRGELRSRAARRAAARDGAGEGRPRRPVRRTSDVARLNPRLPQRMSVRA